MFRGITANVFILGLVSLFTDVSSEMIYPLLPLFLTSVLGVGPAFLGVIEGVAESTASLLKLASGIISDRVPRRKGLVLAGYSLSAVARPLIAAAATPVTALFIRFADRVGKGIRTSPRDALVADSTPPEARGLAFGFHRSMDHAGAIIGPLAATFLLTFVTRDLRTVSWLAPIPGVIAVLLTAFKVREVARAGTGGAGTTPRITPRGTLRTYLFVLFLFTLGNSSDTFLLLRAGQLGVAPQHIPLLWTLFHVVKMTATTPFGALSDRIGRRRMIAAGWFVYALAYIGFAFATTSLHIWLLFAFYGLFYGLTEGVEKALIADIVSPAERGGAFGWYNFAIGVGALPASLLFGFLWQHWGAQPAFVCGAGLACLAAISLVVCVKVKRPVRPVPQA